MPTPFLATTATQSTASHNYRDVFTKFILFFEARGPESSFLTRRLLGGETLASPTAPPHTYAKTHIFFPFSRPFLFLVSICASKYNVGFYHFSDFCVISTAESSAKSHGETKRWIGVWE
ncbi:hypothetical protein ACFX2A_025240 [Malus domestica]